MSYLIDKLDHLINVAVILRDKESSYFPYDKAQQRINLLVKCRKDLMELEEP